MAQVQVAEATLPAVTSIQGQTSFAEILVDRDDIASAIDVVREDSPEYSPEVLNQALQMRMYEAARKVLEDIGDGVIDSDLTKWMEFYRRQERQQQVQLQTA